MSRSPSSDPPTRRRMSYEDRHQQLLDIAEQLFAEQTYPLTSMEDIARAANVTRPIVYNHFETKEGAFVACIKRIYETHHSGLAAMIDPLDPPVDQFRAAADYYMTTLGRNEGRWLLLVTSASVLTGRYRDELNELRFGHIQVLADLIGASLPAAPPDAVEASAHALSGIGERLGHWWLTRPDLDRADIVEHFVSIAVHGFGQWLED